MQSVPCVLLSQYIQKYWNLTWWENGDWTTEEPIKFCGGLRWALLYGSVLGPDYKKKILLLDFEKDVIKLGEKGLNLR